LQRNPVLAKRGDSSRFSTWKFGSCPSFSLVLWPGKAGTTPYFLLGNRGVAPVFPIVWPGKAGTTPYFLLGNRGVAPVFPTYSRGWCGIGIDGPDIYMQRAFPIDIIPPQLNLQPPREEELEGIVGFV